MKKATVFFGLILICALLYTKQGEAQTWTVSVNGGYSIKHAPVAGLDFGVNFKHFNIRSGFQAHLSSSVNDGIVFMNRIGHTENIGDNFYITGQLGWAYILKSNDRKDLNKSEYLYILEGGMKWDFKERPMATYISMVKAGDLYIPSIGLRMYFP